MTPAPALSVEGLSVEFRTRSGIVRALDNVSFAVGKGETIALVGESGSGKSVTAYAVMGILDPAGRVSAGRAMLGDMDLLAATPKALAEVRGRKIAMIFQEPMTALNPVMPVGRQIAEAIETHQPELGRKQVRTAVVEAMTAVAITEPENRLRDYPHQFSGGQRQRLLIAMALVNHPSLLIADEPTTALDVTVQAQILLLLKALQQRNGLGMLFISHDLAVVAQIADRVAVMRRGMLLETGTRDQVFLNPRHAYTKSLLGAVPTLTTDRTQPLATLAAAADGAAGTLVEQAPGHWVRSILPV